MHIKTVKFIKSATNPSHYPPPEFPEIAFAGRSNVGKSSLINRLLNRKKLVRTSKTPGCTQTINFFEVDNRIMFVDLPGYGYAKVPKKVKEKWGPMVEAYFDERKNLQLVVVILDIRRNPSPEDLNLLDWLHLKKIPLTVVLTKIDKLSKQKRTVQKTFISNLLDIDERDILLFSAKTGEGKEKLWERIFAKALKEESQL